jgi:hypothetical protein
VSKSATVGIARLDAGLFQLPQLLVGHGVLAVEIMRQPNNVLAVALVVERLLKNGEIGFDVVRRALLRQANDRPLLISRRAACPAGRGQPTATARSPAHQHRLAIVENSSAGSTVRADPAESARVNFLAGDINVRAMHARHKALSIF